MENKILVKNGEIDADDEIGSVEEQRQRIRAAIAKASVERKPLLLHLHGGLVSQARGEAIAEKCQPHYEDAGAVPLFFVWQTGFWEIIVGNLGRVLSGLLAKWAVRWVIKRIESKLPAGLVEDGEDDDWEPDAAMIEALEYSAEEQAADADLLEQDADLQSILDDLWVQISSLPEGQKQDFIASAGTADTGEIPEVLYLKTDLLESEQGLHGVLNPLKKNIPSVLASLVVAVLKRYKNRTQHRFHATVVEELLRLAYIDELGKGVWGAMKDEAERAFEGEDTVGDFFLQTLSEVSQRPDVILVGHSAGSIFASHLLKSEKAIGDYNVVFMAPAVTYSLFQETLNQAEDKIKTFRMFAMHDSLERRDDLLDEIPFLYPSSLLYIVSGAFEDKVDEPILGMERFHSADYSAAGRDDSLLDSVRGFLNEGNNRVVWSETLSAGPGLNSGARDHGAFDNIAGKDEGDGVTMVSVADIVRGVREEAI